MPTVNVEGVNIYYSVRGKGLPIVFIHPPLLTSSNFSYQIEGLSTNYKVITFDIRGHGRSEYSNQPLTYSLIVKDLICLLDHLEIRNAFICGYSTGGSIVLEFLLTYAERALGGVIISGMSEVKGFYLKNRIALAVKLAKSKAIPLLSLAVISGNSNNHQMFKKMYKEASYGDARNIEQYYRNSLIFNRTNQLSAINVPVLLVYGTKDQFFHKYAHILHKKLPFNELVLLDKEKHQIPTKAATKLNRIINTFIQTKMDNLN
ncbi:MAG: alpha/beta fold hydrolase [Bacillus sp. (in: firmicutes)]